MIVIVVAWEYEWKRVRHEDVVIVVTVPASFQ